MFHKLNSNETINLLINVDSYAPQKEFIKFEKSGHNPAFEEPEKFNKEIIRIYEQVK